MQFGSCHCKKSEAAAHVAARLSALPHDHRDNNERSALRLRSSRRALLTPLRTERLKDRAQSKRETTLAPCRRAISRSSRLLRHPSTSQRTLRSGWLATTCGQSLTRCDSLSRRCWGCLCVSIIYSRCRSTSLRRDVCLWRSTPVSWHVWLPHALPHGIGAFLSVPNISGSLASLSSCAS
jgi:hypothetical protein